MPYGSDRYMHYGTYTYYVCVHIVCIVIVLESQELNDPIRGSRSGRKLLTEFRDDKTFILQFLLVA